VLKSRIRKSQLPASPSLENRDFKKVLKFLLLKMFELVSEGINSVSNSFGIAGKGTGFEDPELTR